MELTLVYINTQTTGFDDPHICELAAEVDTGVYQSFHRYILPGKPVEAQATKLNELELSPDGTRLFLKGNALDACILKCALKAFVKWLQGIKNPVLVDLCVSYHTEALNLAFANFPKLRLRYEKAVHGERDTLPVFKMKYPPGTSLTRAALVARVLGEEFSYEKYNAREHVRVLRKVIKKEGITKDAILKYGLVPGTKQYTYNPGTPKIDESPSGTTGSAGTPQRKRKRKNQDKDGKDGKEKKRKSITDKETQIKKSKKKKKVRISQ